MNYLLDLIRVALDHRKDLDRKLSKQEWVEIKEKAAQQAVSGITFCGMKKLPDNQWPDMDLKLEWIGESEQIKAQNRHVDQQTAEIWKRLTGDGLEAAILKGQGIATLYGDEMGQMRQPGDIDIWVKGGYRAVCDYIQRTIPNDDLAYHRFHYNFFRDTEVELHHRPTQMRNLLDDRKLAKWYNSFGADSFVYLEDKGFAVPPVEFNRIFILTHIYRHFLFEGIGLRQVIDYYFVLKANGGKDKEEIAKILKELRMTRFAEAIMWILHKNLGLEEEYLICGMNEKEGRFVLGEMEQTGNFGQADQRFKGMSKICRMTKHGIHLLLHYPSEVIWTPTWLLYHKVWKWVKKREIRSR